MTTETKPPVVFWIISAIALAWNLMGLANFGMHSMITPEMIAEMPEAQKALYENSPGWLKIPYGVATIGGVIGAILLLMRNKLALPLFLISLVAVIIQMGYSMIASNAIEVFGLAQALIMPLVVIGISAFLVYYARKSMANGWIKS